MGAVYDFPQTAVMKCDFEVRCARHELEPSHLRQVLEVKTEVDPPLARMIGQVSPVCCQQLGERLEAPPLQEVA
jgi:hypothetical protein